MIKVEVTAMEISETFLGNDPSKWKSYLFTPVASPSNDIEETEACNICGNQVSCSSRIGNIKCFKCKKC